MMPMIFLALYLGCGVLMARMLLPGKDAVVRLWLGLCLGLFLMMWLPLLAAFPLRFGLWAHAASAAMLAALTGACFLARSREKPKPWGEKDTRQAKALLVTALPLLALTAFLFYTHNLRQADGALHVGQSTYGDLPLHTSIITSMRDAAVPSDYAILPGAQLSYPFLADTLSTSFMVLGASLRTALLAPSVLMAGLVYTGFMLFALRVAPSRRVAVLAFYLLFVNGGLGFLYPLDMAGVSLGADGSSQLQMGTWGERLRNILNGWYQTPANHAEFTRYNLRWSNIVADLIVPQRTFLAGWVFLMPCLWLLADGLEAARRDTRQFLLLGVLAGGLPLIHTHSFLALALASFGWLLRDLFRKKDMRPWVPYVAAAAALSLPQLVFFTFRQARGSEHFLRVQFNWVNGAGGMKDFYLFFYLKNIGLPFLLILFSLFEKKGRALYIAALAIWLPAEFIIFQPNEYDNNKLLYAAYALACIPAASYAWLLYDRLAGIGARRLMAGLALIAFFLSGALALAREAASDYVMFTGGDIRAARWVEENTERDALFMTGTQHINPVSSLAGRRIVCGPALWLYYHGFNLAQRQEDIRAFYASDSPDAELAARYGARYAMVSSHERAEYGADEAAFDRLYKKVYGEDGISIYDLWEAAP